MIELVRLTSEMESQYNSFIKEWRDTGETIVPMSSDLKALSFSEFLRNLAAYETEDGCPENFVPGTTWFLVNEEGRILGAVNIRHRLNDYLLSFGGHIGYGIRKSERRKGYAATMLSLALGKAKALGIPRVLITCDKNNTGSARTIQKNGGVLENEVPEEGRITQRYWIDLTKAN